MKALYNDSCHTPVQLAQDVLVILNVAVAQHLARHRVAIGDVLARNTIF